ncbi:MAG: PAS domain S-box protein [Magnetospirillum sp.]|nr:PAS domain S-box protein [Magnetospirillum sp.]
MALLGAALAVAAILGLTVRIDLYEHERYQQSVRLDTVRHASMVRARLEAALNLRLHLTKGLAAFAKAHPRDDLDHFQSFAAGLAKTGLAGIRSLQLAPNAIVKYVYPLQGNEVVLHHDLLADPARRAAVQRTIDKRLFIVAGPFSLLQGGEGLVARDPIFTGPDNNSFWGFATVVLDIGPILAEGGLITDADPHFQVALRGKDSLGAEGAPFFGDAGLFERDPVLLSVLLPHGSWQLAVMPAKGWPTTGPYSALIWSMGILIALLGGFVVYSRLFASASLRLAVARATLALRDSEERFRSVAESATDAIISVDGTGTVVFWNPAAAGILQYQAAEAVGRPINALLLPPAAEAAHPLQFFAPLPRAAAQADGVITSVATRKDGVVLPVELTVSHWTHNGETFLTAILRDVSERKAAEREQALLKERYFQAQKMEAVGTLASGAAHEFNNILNTLMACTEKAIGELPPDSAATPTLHDVLDASWRAAEIVRQLLIFSEKQTEPDAPFDPVAALDKLLPTIRATLPPSVTLVTDIRASGLTLAMNHDRFCHVVWNLAINAVRAMVATGGTLTIRLEEVTLPAFSRRADDGAVRLALGDMPVGPALKLTVADTGQGIDAETLARVFEPFFTTANVGDGLGLGLPVVLGIVQADGGAIEVATRKGGDGTRFEITLRAGPPA